MYHLERIQRAAPRWVKGLRNLNYYEDRLKELKLQSLEKRRVRNDLVLTHKIIYNQTDPEGSPEDQDLEGHHLDFFNKPGEPV